MISPIPHDVLCVAIVFSILTMAMGRGIPSIALRSVSVAGRLKTTVYTGTDLNAEGWEATCTPCFYTPL